MGPRRLRTVAGGALLCRGRNLSWKATVAATAAPVVAPPLLRYHGLRADVGDGDKHSQRDLRVPVGGANANSKREKKRQRQSAIVYLLRAGFDAEYPGLHRHELTVYGRGSDTCIYCIGSAPNHTLRVLLVLLGDG